MKAKAGKVIPLTLEMDANHRQLIISGPNTGGKTVGLKTLGLLALMAQAGVPVPATTARLPVFDSVLADIGDYQSIEQNLSTFSAHVTNIDFISRTATAHSLVLLDELGSATDPEEGAALAVAIADHFRRSGALSIISTHHTSLKVYAANTTGVLNAAVGFNEDTLQPTYELRVGVPGASAGINIAQRLGLNRQITDAARERLTTQTQDVSKFLDRLHSQLRDLEQDRERAQKREQDLAREQKRLEDEGQQEQRQKVREFERKMESLIKDFEYQVREAVSAVQDRAAAQKLTKQAEQRIAKLRREFKEQFDAGVVAHKTGADQGDPNARPHEIKHISEGRYCKFKSLGRTAVIKRKIDENTFEVEIGNMKMKIPRHDVAEVFSPGGAAARARCESCCGGPRARHLRHAQRRFQRRPLSSMSSAATWTKPPARWKSLSTAHFSRGSRACVSSTAAAWASSVRLSVNICKNILTSPPSPNPSRTKAAPVRQWLSYESSLLGP